MKLLIIGMVIQNNKDLKQVNNNIFIIIFTFYIQ